MYILNKLFANFRNHMRYVASILLLVPIISYVSIQVVVMSGKLIDSLGKYDEFMRYLLFLAIFLLLQFVLNQLLKIFEKILTFKVTHDIKARLYEKVINIKYDALHQWAPDDLFQMWNQDIDEIQQVSIGAVIQFGIKLISALFAFIKLSTISLLFAAISLIFYAIAAIPIHIIGNKNKKAAKELREAEGTVNRSFFEGIEFIKLIKTYGKKKEVLKKFNEANEMFSIKMVKRLVISNFFRMLAHVLNAIAPAVIIIIGIYKITAKEITVGDIVIATTLLRTIQAPIADVGNFIIKMKGILFKIERLYTFLGSEEELFSDSNESSQKVELDGDIEFKDVAINRSGKSILSPISFKIRYGEKVAIVGESGSGKTTIANLIIRLLGPDSGQIIINDKSIQEYGITEYREKIMYVQSNVFILNASLMDNLKLLGGKTEDIYSVAKGIGFHNDILNLENGYQSWLDSKGSNLSGGQRKRLGFIRGVSVPKDIYVFDEVTTGLDPESANIMTNYIVNKINSTVILITHELTSAKVMDKIIVLKNGSVMDIGTHEEVIERCEYYQELLTNMEC